MSSYTPEPTGPCRQCGADHLLHKLACSACGSVIHWPLCTSDCTQLGVLLFDGLFYCRDHYYTAVSAWEKENGVEWTEDSWGIAEEG